MDLNRDNWKKIPLLSTSDTPSITINKKEQVPEMECPFCHSHVVPNIEVGLFDNLSHAKRDNFVAFFPCCESRYFVSCEIDKNKHPISYQNWEVEPLKLQCKLAPIPDAIKKMSPLFECIYNEAQIAKAHGLTQISGGGFRKALEFLLKDYAIHLSPKAADHIRSLDLNKCILRFKDNPVLKDLADRAAWLGNDQIHYENAHKDKNLDDVQALVEYVMALVNLNLLHPELVKDIKPVKKKENKGKRTPNNIV